jgi:hypothetical protein
VIEIARGRGIGEKAKRHDLKALLIKKIPEMNGPTAQGLLFELILHETPNRWGDPKPSDVFKRAAKEYRIDLQKIEEGVRERMKAKKAKGPKRHKR